MAAASDATNQTKWYTPRFWQGMTYGVWRGVVARHGLRSIAPERLPMAFMITLASLMNSVFAWRQRATFGAAIDQTPLPADPIFIIGHWRSGTTLLHEYLIRDPRHTYPNTYECFAPSHFLYSGGFMPKLLRSLLPDRRPVDNMAAGWERPQEDEFALGNLGTPSPYLTIAFPQAGPSYPEYLTLDVPPAELARWKDSLAWFLKSLAVAYPGKRIVLKSPPHTARVGVLAEMFPQARFVHIVRNPYDLYPSTVNLWKRLTEDERLQRPHHPWLEESVYDTLVQMYEGFDRGRDRIARGHYCEVKYESLVAQPLAELERVYAELGLGDFAAARPEIETYIAAQKDYKKNRFDKPPAQQAEIARRWRFYFERYGYPL